MILYHGTSYDRYSKIKKEGFRPEKGGANWNVSEYYTYFWSPERLFRMGECEEEYSHDEAFRRATDSGIVGLWRSKVCKIVIIKVEIDGAEYEIEDDESCENMQGAVRTSKAIARDKITEVKITRDLCLYRGLILGLFSPENSYAAILLNKEERALHKIMRDVADYDTVYESAW